MTETENFDAQMNRHVPGDLGPTKSGMPASDDRFDELQLLKHALECIAGKSQWIDNTMSDKQIAKYVLWRLYDFARESPRL